MTTVSLLYEADGELRRVTSHDGGRTWDDRPPHERYETLDLSSLPSAGRVALAIGLCAVTMPIACVAVAIEAVRRLRR